ncbi:MAG TPA: BON domain-containing protein [Gemmatimonadales bacterium]|jgi:osmotically-inducible protein OsmY
MKNQGMHQSGSRDGRHGSEGRWQGSSDGGRSRQEYNPRESRSNDREENYGPREQDGDDRSRQGSYGTGSSRESRMTSYRGENDRNWGPDRDDRYMRGYGSSDSDGMAEADAGYSSMGRMEEDGSGSDGFQHNYNGGSYTGGSSKGWAQGSMSQGQGYQGGSMNEDRYASDGPRGYRESERSQGSGSRNRTGRESSARWGGPQGSGPHAGKGPKGYQRSDERIREDVSEELARHGDIDASEIEVKVTGGDVTLSGTVEDRDTKRRAEACVENVSGVKDVQNNLKISRDRSQDDRATQATMPNSMGKQKASSAGGSNGNQATTDGNSASKSSQSSSH